MSNTKPSAFPSTHCEALTILYLQNQDLTGKTPEEIQAMYFETLKTIEEDYKANHKPNWLY